MNFKTKVVEVKAWREGCGEPMPEWVKANFRDKYGDPVP